MALLSSLLALLTSILTLTTKPTFVLDNEWIMNGSIPVSKFTTRTGIQIAIAKTDGPLVKGYYSLATPASDDNGLPHTLEHLVFLGSEDYPYKGALDLISNRMNADGTNAFTDIDYTCYKSSNVGKDAFLGQLPVYLDHILFPKLANSTFITEVHHINAEGLDGGVVYSEMEGSPDFSGTYYSMIKALFEDTGYDKNVGGALKNLRENTTHALIVDFYKKFYRPENLIIIICGDVTIHEVIKTIDKLEKKILSKPKLPKFVKPWATPMPPLKKTIVMKKLNPSLDEGLPEVYIAWRGPNYVKEYRKFLACTILLRIIDSTYDGYNTYSESALYLIFEDVELDQVNSVYPKLEGELKSIANGTVKIDMDAIKGFINEKLASYVSDLETSPHDTISVLISKYFLKGVTANEFKTILSTEKELEYLLTVPEKYWINLLKEYFINKKYVQITGIPSAAELDRLNKEEDERIKQQKIRLGIDGLKKKGDELNAAIAQNSIPVPNSLLTSLPIPSITNINYLDVKIYRTGDENAGKPKGLDIDSWPIYAEAYDCRTKFVFITATFFTQNIGVALRPYLYLFLKLIDTLPVSDETLEGFQTISTQIRIGLTDSLNTFSCGIFSQTATFTVQMLRSQYEIGIRYFIAKLQSTIFDTDSIVEQTTYLLDEVKYSLLNFRYITLDLLRSMNYGSDTNVKVHSTLYQEKFLKSLLSKLDDEYTAQQIVADLNELRNFLVSTTNLGVHVTADFSALNSQKTDLNSGWQGFGFSSGPKKLNIVADWEVMNAPNNVNSQGEILALDSTESGFLYHTSSAINDFNHDDLPALLVSLNYLTQMEGVMWNRIRGSGYAYTYRLQSFPSEGQIQFQLYRSGDVSSGFEECLNIINEVIRQDFLWQQSTVDSAKGVTIFQIVNLVPTYGEVPSEMLLLSFKKGSVDYYKNLVTKISAVTIDDVKRVAKLYMTSIFNTTDSKTAVICSKEKASAAADGFEEHGFTLAVKDSWETSALAQFY